MFTNGQIFLIFFEHFPLPQAGSVANIPEISLSNIGNKAVDGSKTNARTNSARGSHLHPDFGLGSVG